MTTFNLNDSIRVRLSPHGQQLLFQYYTSYGSTPPSLDEDGTLKIQIWLAMHVFGEHMIQGSPRLPLESMDVELVRAQT